MTNERAVILLEEILDSVRLATSFVEGYDLSQFLRDERTQAAVAMHLIAIGELASKLMRGHRDLLLRHPQVPWLRMTAMRNQIAHGYTDLDFGVVWDTTVNSLPELQRDLPPIIKSLSDAATLPSSTPTPDP